MTDLDQRLDDAKDGVLESDDIDQERLDAFCKDVRVSTSSIFREEGIEPTEATITAIQTEVLETVIEVIFEVDEPDFERLEEEMSSVDSAKGNVLFCAMGALRIAGECGHDEAAEQFGEFTSSIHQSGNW